MIVLTRFKGRRTSFDRSGEFAATVVGVLLADNSATLGFVLLSAMVKDLAVSETKELEQKCMCFKHTGTDLVAKNKAQASAKCFSLCCNRCWCHSLIRGVPKTVMVESKNCWR